jgi:hypothetical protein
MLSDILRNFPGNHSLWATCGKREGTCAAWFAYQVVGIGGSESHGGVGHRFHALYTTSFHDGERECNCLV